MGLWLAVFCLLLFLSIPLLARRPEETVIEMNVSVCVQRVEGVSGWVCCGGVGQTTEDSHSDEEGS